MLSDSSQPSAGSTVLSVLGGIGLTFLLVSVQTSSVATNIFLRTGFASVVFRLNQDVDAEAAGPQGR